MAKMTIQELIREVVGWVMGSGLQLNQTKCLWSSKWQIIILNKIQGHFPFKVKVGDALNLTPELPIYQIGERVIALVFFIKITTVLVCR